MQSAAEGCIRLDSPAGRWLLATTVLGSSVAALDATVVNVALPSIGRDLGAGVDGLQWILNGYLLSLSALLLLGGSLGDRYGRRRMFMTGAAIFAVASLLCGLAPSLPVLVLARALQGVGGALLTPGSLAIIQASIQPEDRGRAIGAWSGLSGVAIAIGPFLGGWLVEAASWRWIFLLNLPLVLAVILIAARHVPETFDPGATGRPDLLGAALAVLGLSGITYALVEWPVQGPTSPVVMSAAVVGLIGIGTFLWVEARSRSPMLPLGIFCSRQFSGANLVTLCVYACVSGVFFLLVVTLQQVVGYSALQSGAATIPLTLLMLALSPRTGALAQRIGPRIPMTVGPLLIAAGCLLMMRIGPGTDYLTVVLPGILVFGLGLALTVAPLTATVLSAVDSRHAGVASATNNAVARLAGLLAVALLPPLAGLTGDAYRQPEVLDAGFKIATRLCAGLATVGGVIAWLTIRSNPAQAERQTQDTNCPLDAPPLANLSSAPAGDSSVR